MTEKRTMSIPEAAYEIGCSETMAWSLVARGLLRSFKVGRRRYTTPQAVGDFLEQREREAAESTAAGAV